MGSKTALFSLKFEEERVKHVKEMESAMHCLTMIYLRRLAFDLAVGANIAHHFTNGLAGLDWVRAFLGRHNTLTTRWSIATSLARIKGFNKNAVAKFFGNLKVAGMFVLPLFVFPRKRMIEPLMNGCPAGSIGAVNVCGSGYIDNTSFFKLMRLFVETVGCTKQTPHLLLLDSHESHKSLEVILYGVVTLTCPPYCTHRLQPLEKTFFISQTATYSRAYENWMLCDKDRPISQFDIIPLFKQAYNTSARVASATNGFNATGLWPLDDSKFDEELFAIAGNQDESGTAVVVAAGVHATLIVANQYEDDIQPASTVIVAADVHIDAHVVPDDASQDEDDIRPPPAVVTNAHDASVAVNQDYIRRLIKTCSPKSVASTSSKIRRRTNTKKVSALGRYV